MQIALAEAKARLSELINRVGAGEPVCITKRGKAVAHLVPPPSAGKTPVDISRIRALAESLGPSSESGADVVSRMRDNARY